MTSARTRVFALLGDPVAHSLSPAMQNAAFRALGLDAVYVALRCGAEGVGPLARALAEAGGGGNATVPHKGALAQALERPSDQVRRLECANTFWGEGGAVAGGNTDVAGIAAALDRLEAPATGWLLIGTGGSARAVAAVALERGAGIGIHSRSSDRARVFRSWLNGLGVRASPPDECEVVINATPLGLGRKDPLPAMGNTPETAKVALDLVYGPQGTRWVGELRTRGLRAEDGREVLVGQGGAALRCWFPGIDPPLEVMRAAVRRALG